MKFKITILVVLMALIAVYAATLDWRVTGDEELLRVMQQIQSGSTADDVRKIMGREPNIFSASTAPSWIEEVAPRRDDGEYWQFFMGYPPRNLIIYFDENGHVVFTTWTST